MGNLSTPKSVQKLQKALHAKAKAEASYLWRDDQDENLTLIVAQHGMLLMLVIARSSARRALLVAVKNVIGIGFTIFVGGKLP